MFKKILVPLDGSPTAQSVLPPAIHVASTFGSEVDLVHVLCKGSADETVQQIDPLSWHMRKAEIEMYLTATAKILARHGLQASKTILEGEASNRIVAHAAAQNSDLILLSSHGSSGLSGWNVSSVGLKVHTGARRSILLIRAYRSDFSRKKEEVEPYRFKNMLVALDGSKRAESVLPIATKLALAQEGTLWLAHVATPAAVAPPFHTQTVDTKPLENSTVQYTETAATYLHHVQQQMECDTQTAVLRGGNIITALNRFSNQKNIDLMLMCAHGRSHTNNAFGSIATSAIIYGSTSLLIFQDLPPDEIDPTYAEIASDQQGGTYTNRKNKNAQPANWNP